MTSVQQVAGEGLGHILTDAASYIHSLEPRLVRVVSHHDVDGICAGSISTAALTRAGYRVHASFLGNMGERELERLGAEEWDVLVISDMGSGQADGLATLERPVIILDHHIKQGGQRPPHIVEANPNDHGLEGAKDVSGASMSFLFALALVPDAAWDLAPLALAGAIGDMQHVDGMRAINASIEEEAVRRGMVERRRALGLSGDTLFHALVRTTDPFFRGLSGRKTEALAVLGKLGIDGDKALEDASQGEVRSLGSYLIILLGGQGVQAPNASRVVGDRLWWPARSTWLDDFSNQVNAAGRLGETGVASAACLGGRAHIDRCVAAREEFRDQVRSGLLSLEERGTSRLEHIQWFEPPARHIAGPLAGLGMIYLFPKDAPVLSLYPDGANLSVSARATDRLVEAGVDMALAMEVAATRVGGRGGGHPVAAGATVPVDARDEFVSQVDEIVGEQLA
jgi:single-stranded-DNA-specific exonuclease